MVSLLMFFYIFLAFFGIMGFMRGWAKELMVIFSVFLALGFIAAFENLLPFTKDLFKEGSIQEYWFRTITVIVMVIFGYQTPRFSRIARSAEKRDLIQDHLLGFIFGLITGYMIIGTLWAYMDAANYPFAPYITSPKNDPYLGETALRLVKWFPPNFWLGQPPWIYVIVIIAFIFVIVVFI